MDDFFRRASEAIIGQDEIIDNFRGNCVLSFFNVPIKHEDHIRRTIKVAEQMQMAVSQVNDRFGQGNLLQVGMGVTTGTVYTSTVGSDECKDYTAMGDAVNLGARLQDQAGPGEILVSDEVYRAVENEYPEAREHVMDLKGAKEPIHAYTLTPSRRSTAQVD